MSYGRPVKRGNKKRKGAKGQRRHNELAAGGFVHSEAMRRNHKTSGGKRR